MSKYTIEKSKHLKESRYLNMLWNLADACEANNPAVYEADVDRDTEHMTITVYSCNEDGLNDDTAINEYVEEMLQRMDFDFDFTCHSKLRPHNGGAFDVYDVELVGLGEQPKAIEESLIVPIRHKVYSLYDVSRLINAQSRDFTCEVNGDNELGVTYQNIDNDGVESRKKLVNAIKLAVSDMFLPYKSFSIEQDHTESQGQTVFNVVFSEDTGMTESKKHHYTLKERGGIAHGIEFEPNGKGGTKAVAVKQVYDSGLSGRPEDGPHLHADNRKGELVWKKDPDGLSDDDLALAKKTYAVLKKKGKLDDVSNKFDTDIAPDLVRTGADDAVKITPDDAKDDSDRYTLEIESAHSSLRENSVVEYYYDQVDELARTVSGDGMFAAKHYNIGIDDASDCLALVYITETGGQKETVRKLSDTYKQMDVEAPLELFVATEDKAPKEWFGDDMEPVVNGWSPNATLHPSEPMAEADSRTHFTFADAEDFAEWLEEQGFKYYAANTAYTQGPLAVYSKPGDGRTGEELVADFMEDKDIQVVRFGIAANDTANADYYFVGDHLSNGNAAAKLDRIGLDNEDALARAFAFVIEE